MENYCIPNPRGEAMAYKYCGRSGLMLSRIALGFWHNFGWSKGESGQNGADYARCREIVECAFDNGITYFDLANNYGPPAGSAEECFGRIMKDSLAAHRDEVVIATKAGHDMWPGPYGEWGSRMTHSPFLTPEAITDGYRSLIAELDGQARREGRSIAELALHWILERPEVTSVIVGASSVEQLKKNLKAIY